MVRIKPLISAVAGNGMPAVAISDNNNLFGLVKFYNAASNGGVKPIIACVLCGKHFDAVHMIPLRL